MQYVNYEDKLGNLQVLEFPDELGEAEIDKAIRSQFMTEEERLENPSFFERTSEAYKRGNAFVSSRLKIWDAMQGKISDEEAFSIEREMMSPYEERRERYSPKNVPEMFVHGAAETAPYMVRGAIKGAKTGMAAGIATVVAGQMGVQAAFAEEVITGPAAVTLGSAYGAAKFGMQVEGADLYKELIDAGVERNIAISWAMPVGAVIGIIEAAQISHIFDLQVPGGWKMAKAGAKSFIKKEIKQKPFQKFISSSIKNMKPYAKFAGVVSLEVLEEAAQETASFLGEVGAHLFDAVAKEQRYRGPDFDDFKTRLGQTIKQGYLSFPGIILPGRLIHGVSQIKTPKTKANESLNETIKEIKPEILKYSTAKEFSESVNIDISEKDLGRLGFGRVDVFKDFIFHKARTEKLQGQFDEMLDESDLTSEAAKQDAEIVRENLSEFLEEYNAAVVQEYKTNRPIVSSVDLGKAIPVSFRPDFKSEHSADRHGAASAVSKIIEDLLLKDPAGKSKPILVLGGVSGAGKTSTIRNAKGEGVNDYAMIKDTNLPSAAKAIKMIDSYLEDGRVVEINYIDRDPVTAFKDGVWKRFISKPERRIVPIGVHLRNAESRQAIKDLTAFYKDVENVIIHVYDNNGKREDAEEISVEDITLHDEEAVRNELEKFIEEKARAGELTATEAATFLGRAAKSEGDSSRASQGVQKGAEAGLKEKAPAKETPTDKLEIEPEESETIVSQLPKLVQEIQELTEKINSLGEKAPDSLKKRQKALIETLEGLRPTETGRKIPKSLVRRFTGQKDLSNKILISEKKLLKEILSSQEKAAKKAFLEGRKKGQQEIITAKQILDRRRAFIRAVRDFFGLDDKDLRSITRKDIRLMSNYEFKLFLENIEAKAAEFAEKRQIKAEILDAINEKELQKVDNLRQYLKLPTLDKMTTEQLNEFNQALEDTQKGDEFLSLRKLETVKNTELAGIKTVREAKERLAEKLGVELEAVDNLDVSPLDKFRYDTILAKRNPFYQLLVDETNSSLMDGEQRFLEDERKVDELVSKARASRKRTLAEKAVPTDEIVFQYLEAKDKKPFAEKMTAEELDLANFLQARFAHFRDYLIQQGTLKKYKNDYITHIRRGFLETWKEDGLLEAFKEVFAQYKEDEAVFKILEDDTENILPLEKFFQFAMRRSDQIKPSKNVAKAFKAYARTMYKKQSLDKIVPALDIYAYSLSPKKTTPRGLQMDRRLIKFVREWVNNKKGRRSSLGGIIPQNGAIDIGMRVINGFVTMIDLGLNIPVGLTVAIGENVTTFVNLGSKKYTTGIARMKTEKGKKVILENEAFVGKSPWRELANTADDLGDKFSKSLFILFSASNTTANKIHLLGSMSEAEWKAGKISDERKALLQREIGRFRNVSGAKSIFGSTSSGSALTKYKTWALPIFNTILDDTKQLTKMLAKGKAKDAIHSLEFQELFRATMTTLLFVLAGKALVDDDDDSFVGELLKKAYRESLTFLGALDPTTLTSIRLVKFLGDIAESVKMIVLLEEYKTKEGYKGVNKLGRTILPRVIRQFLKEDKGRRVTG